MMKTNWNISGSLEPCNGNLKLIKKQIEITET